MNIPGRLFEKDESVYSDWFPRGGDNGIFRIQVIDSESGASPASQITVSIFTKNTETQGDPTAHIGSMNTDATPSNGDITSLVIEGAEDGLLELVRYRIECKNGWMAARMLTPVFYDTAIG